MARKVGQIVGRGRHTWLVRVFNGRDPENKKRKYLNQTIHGGLRDAQAHLNKMLGERDRGRNLDSSKQTLNQYLDRWLEVCAKPRLRAKSLQDYEGLLRRYVRFRLGPKAVAHVSAFDIQTLYRDLLDRSLSARSIRYTHAVLRSGMSIRSYGLFWRRDEVNWNPGRGNRGAFRLLGRGGEYRPNLRVADFRQQYGIYILHGNHGSYYVGQTQDQGLGARLLDHCRNHHQDEWDRFSWFGFRDVLLGRDRFGLCRLRKMAQAVFHSQGAASSDIEALLIRAMGPRNIQQMNFDNADEWTQVGADEAERYMERVVP